MEEDTRDYCVLREALALLSNERLILRETRHAVTWGLEHRTLGQIDAIGVDEIQYSKWHKYLTLVYQMWEPYLKLIRENCSEALHILDRFHIVANMNKALDNARAEETSRMRREGRAPILRKSCRLLLRRSENLGAGPYFRLRDLLRYNLKTVRAYLVKEAFQQLREYGWPAWAGKFLDESPPSKDAVQRRC